MVKHMTRALLLGLALAVPAGAFAAQAQAGQPPAAGRQVTPLGQRVREGVRTGQLTRGELRRVRARIAGVRRQAQQLRGDGAFSAAERREIRRAWRGVSRHLFQLRHNAIRRGGR